MSFSFGNIAQKIAAAFGGRKEGSVLGIDIGASSAKIVQLCAARGRGASLVFDFSQRSYILPER